MNAVKKQRRVLRTAFTTKVESNCSKEKKIVAFQFLETKMMELDVVYSTYNQAVLFQSNADEADINKDWNPTIYIRHTQYITAKKKISTIASLTSENVMRTVLTNILETSKFPKLELPKFCGNIKHWLPFWSQFKKINDHPSINNEDKMQCNKQ